MYKNIISNVLSCNNYGTTHYSYDFRYLPNWTTSSIEKLVDKLKKYFTDSKILLFDNCIKIDWTITSDEDLTSIANILENKEQEKGGGSGGRNGT